MFEGHQSPVTGIDCHVAQGQVDFSHLFITSSFDWTVKLWSQKVLHFILITLTNAEQLALCYLCVKQLHPFTICKIRYNNFIYHF